ncbi:NAD(P)-dependent oxidoreductase [Paraprevotella xylaniphila]|uniref:NAD(P)-dependent oxidoreductase n=1 Tax=Paraprevotella xylaniphila TaxID=454155 RepID=UPI00266592CD|nr:NAD(P)-dependent oxidoreductase [Paraprevotella xylaniphila]
MKIVVDDKIPFIREAIAQISTDVIYKPGIAISPDDIHDADALIVRTRTRCDETLLKGSKVSFIATATIGYDHLDIEYLKRAHITWTNCPGCNANSVGQYIHSCLLLLEKEKGYDLSKTTVGLVGVGHVGHAVIEAIRPLGVQILLNDPPQKETLRKAGKPHEFFLKMEELQEKCDIISFHTPLITKGPYPTFHLANKTFFNALKKHPIIINTSRGAVVDNTDVLQALKDGIIRDAIIDTWENEPNINQELLNLIYIGTPHIAGYSADGKANATRMALTALCNHFHLPATFQIRVPQLPEEELPEPHLTETERALALYNPHTDSLKLKSHPTMFEELRGNYPLRREFIE